MVHVPVEDTGQDQAGKIGNFQAQGTTVEVQVSGDLDELCQGCALQGNSVLTPQGEEVDLQAMITSDHGQAGETALRRFGLKDHRDAASKAELQAIENICGEFHGRDG